LFFLSSSSFLQAKGGLENLLEGPEINRQVSIARTIKKQKVRVVEELIKVHPTHRLLPFLKTHYKRQIEALKEITDLPSSSASSSNSLNPLALAASKLKYNDASQVLKEIKNYYVQG
jgi:inactivated superfamily I helicase